MIANNGESENEKTRQRDISVTMKITILRVLHGEGGELAYSMKHSREGKFNDERSLPITVSSG